MALQAKQLVQSLDNDVIELTAANQANPSDEINQVVEAKLVSEKGHCGAVGAFHRRIDHCRKTFEVGPVSSGKNRGVHLPVLRSAAPLDEGYVLSHQENTLSNLRGDCVRQHVNSEGVLGCPEVVVRVSHPLIDHDKELDEGIGALPSGDPLHRHVEQRAHRFHVDGVDKVLKPLRPLSMEHLELGGKFSALGVFGVCEKVQHQL